MTNPNLRNFTIDNRDFSTTSFTVNKPQSDNTTGAFSYSSSNTEIATVTNFDAVGFTVTMLKAGLVTITATQEAGGGYSTASITATFTINETKSRIRILMRSLYTNNAQVFYKPHSLAPGGIGSVRNSRFKSRRT